MERTTNAGGTELNEPAPPAAMREAVAETGTVPPSTGGQTRCYLGIGMHLARHLLEMVIAMFAGMGVLGLVLWALGEPPGYDTHVLVKYGVMGAFMAIPMVAWMRYRGHPWADGWEMTAAMLVPMFALVLPVELDMALPGLSEDSLMTLAHVAMIGGMAALMVYRWDRYAHGAHTPSHGAPTTPARLAPGDAPRRSAMDG